MATEGAPATDDVSPSSIEALRRLKAVEAEGEAELRRVKSEGEAFLVRVRAEAEAAVVSARAEAEQRREAALAAARAQIDAEVTTILTAGRVAASAVPHRTAQDLETLEEKLLDALFGEFRGGRAASE